MQFPAKPWINQLDIPTPWWATHQVDFTNPSGNSYSVWVGDEFYRYFKETEEDAIEDVEGLNGRWDINMWRNQLRDYPYLRITDLRGVEENE